jgi:hypothetical protein
LHVSATGVLIMLSVLFDYFFLVVAFHKWD